MRTSIDEDCSATQHMGVFQQPRFSAGNGRRPANMPANRQPGWQLANPSFVCHDFLPGRAHGRKISEKTFILPFVSAVRSQPVSLCSTSGQEERPCPGDLCRCIFNTAHPPCDQSFQGYSPCDRRRCRDRMQSDPHATRLSIKQDEDRPAAIRAFPTTECRPGRAFFPIFPQ